MAKDYLSQNQNRSVLLMHADYVFKTHSKTDSIPGFKKLNQSKKDSALFESSKFAKYLKDSVVLANYMQALDNELNNLGFRVFRENSIDSFLLLKTPAFILNLAQAEIEEYAIPYVDSKVYDDTLKYTRKFGLNAVNLNCWFELTKLNSDTAAVVLYSTHSASDQVNGRFKRNPLFLEVSYRYTTHFISIDEVNGLISYSGNRDAAYLNDYLLNEELKHEFPADYQPTTYWHYNRIENNLLPAGEWRFVRQN